MPTTRRSRTLPAPPERVWEVVADPEHMPRWWPEVKRMESIEDNRFTQVFMTKKGRLVRMDFRLLASEAPGPGGEPPGRRAWEQEFAGTPLERVIGESITEVLLEGDDDRTRVTIELRQKLRGYSRTGGVFFRRAARSRLDEALEGLERILIQ